MTPITTDIIIATYNRAELLPEALKSVQSQTCPKWRCWIAEDGKTPETLEAITPFRKDDRFVYLPGDHAGRPAPPRNRAMLQGNGKFIAFLDDDDYWLPEKLKRQVEFMERHPGCMLLGCNAYKSGAGAEKGNASSPPYFQKKSFFGHIPYERFVQENHIILSSAIIRRDVLDRTGLFNETLLIAEDHELWLRIGALGEIWNLPAPLLVSRDTGLTKYYPSHKRRENYRAKAMVLDAALTGVGMIPSPLSYPENERYAAACRYEKNFYLAGPRFLGRLRHALALRIKECLSRPL